MLIALLAVLGVNLIVIMVVAAAVLSRRRWISRQPGAFHGAIRVTKGELHPLSSKWSRGYGRWLRLGDHPLVVACSSGAARVEIAATGEQRDLLLGAERPGNVHSTQDT